MDGASVGAQHAVPLLVFLLCLSSLRCGATKRDALQAEAILRNACTYLWNKQSADGGWHSETHGILRGGQAWTPFVLSALLEVPDDVYTKPELKIERALDFIRTSVNAEGVLGVSDPDVLEYPNYTTAYALRVLVKHGAARDKLLIEKMKKYLASQQFVEQRGFRPDDLVYGSWGFGETNLPPHTPGFVDISHARRILEALREAKHGDQRTFDNAQDFLRLLQKHPTESRTQPGVDGTGKPRYDGGFYFSPVVLARNKGGRETDSTGGESAYRSYATATCDGVLALLAAGLPRDDNRIQAALQWLHEYPALDRPQGIPGDAAEQWHKVMFYYHLLVRSEMYAAFGIQGEWRSEMVDLLESRQREDGSFSNPYGELNKEDDPLLATAMVVGTMVNVLR